MSREIKFRGRCKISNDWVYGDLIHGIYGKTYIFPNKTNLDYVKHCDSLYGVEINPETVSQYTGIKDKNGKEIYEGVNLRIDNWICEFKVVWDDVFARFTVMKMGDDRGRKMDYIPEMHCVVIE